MSFLWNMVFVCVLSLGVGEGRASDFVSVEPRGGISGAKGILAVFGGIGSTGREFRAEDNEWTRFARQHDLWLVSAGFPVPKDVRNRQECYYYPESGFMSWFLSETDRLASAHGLGKKKLLLVGFSGGAHFVHRLAIWKPERVMAVVAHAAGWWDEPTEGLRKVPMLVTCGEQDERYEACLRFYRAASGKGCPLLWRSYRGLGHAVDARTARLAQAFLKAYLQEDRARKTPWVGDIQEWKAYRSDEASCIPPEYRVAIPSETVARVWERADE